jgi:hypothetical protein
MKVFEKYSIPAETQKEIVSNFDTKKERKQFVKEHFTPNLTTFEIQMISSIEEKMRMYLNKKTK